MNVIVANKQKKIIDNANIDAIKDFTGLFNVDDLIIKFKNYFFNKLILDATSVVNFTNRDVLEKLATSIGAERLVILLPEKPLPPKSFVDLLLELKIYNFSNKIEDVISYIAKPNTYEDIIKNVKYDDSFYVDNSIKESDEIDQVESSPLENNNDVVDNKNNFTNNSFEQNNNTSFLIQNMDNKQSVGVQNYLDKKVIGFKNITIHAGTTTLIYLLKKMAQNKFKKRVLAVESNNDDFKYYQEEDMVSVDQKKINNVIENSNAEIIFIDLNNFMGNMDFVNDVIYLVEPSIFKLNKLMMTDRFAFRSLENKKVVLNQSFLSNNEANAFAKEAGVNIFMNIPPLNDRINNDIIVKLLNNIM